MSEVERPRPHSPAARGPEIVFRDVHARWACGGAESGTDGERDEALAGLSLTLPAGQITVLLGGHGSGKTLMARHLLGETAPDRGQVLVDGTSLWELPEAQRHVHHDMIGVLRGGTAIRESELDDLLNVVDNLSAQLRHSAAEDAEAAARDCLGHFELADLAEAMPADLEPAPRRRLALALALAADPALVVIDDPGQALDFNHFEDMITTIRGWQQRTRSTMLLTVHSLRVARDLGHHVAVLRDGRVIAHGTPADVLDGVTDDATYHQRFAADLGGSAEADPQRGRAALRLLNVTGRRRQYALVASFAVLVIVIVVLLGTGIIDNPLIPGNAAGPPKTRG